MTWGKTDDKLHSHPKVAALDVQILPAMGLWVLAQSWCNDALTDGFIPSGQPARLAGKRVGPVIKALVVVGLWEVVEGGYQMHDFHDCNPQRVDVLRKRTADAARKRGGIRAESERNPSPPIPNNPDPVPQRSIERRGALGYAADHPAVTAYLAAAKGVGIADAVLYPKVGAIAARADELIAEGVPEADVVWAYSEIGRKGGAVSRPDIELEKRQRNEGTSIIAGQQRTEAALRLLEEAGA